MTTREEGATTWRRAVASHGEDLVRRALVGIPRPARTHRDAAFRAYLPQVRARLRQDPIAFTVVSSTAVAVGASSSIVEVAMRGPASVAAGDLLYTWWRNAPDLVPTAEQHEVAYWTTPLPHRPSIRRRTTSSTLWESVVDLSSETPAARGSVRIVPRFYTVSSARSIDGESVVRLQVTMTDAWPDRAAAFLHRVRPGDVVHAWALPHPHRLPLDAPSVAVATGSGAAGVFAALRAGARGVRLHWGLGDKVLEPGVRAELADFEASGALEELVVVSAPERVTGALALRLGAVGSVLDRGGTVYVSGNEAMGVDVDAVLTGAFGDRLRVAHDELRYIVST